MPRLRSGGVAKSARLQSTGAAERSYPCPRTGAAAGRSCPMPEDRGGGWEEQPHIQEAEAAHAEEGREALLHIQGQEG